MKRQVKYRVMTIPGKLTLEIRLFMDTSRNTVAPNGEFTSNSNGDIYTTLVPLPTIAISIVRSPETDENGQRQRAPFNPNDALMMSRYQLPIFVGEMVKANESLRVPEMFNYVNKRLELNDALADQERRVFIIGTTTVELTPAVIVQPNEDRVEGLRMKFNNEQSIVALTLNDIESLVFTMTGLNVEGVVLQLHRDYFKNDSSAQAITSGTIIVPKTEVDIKPKLSDDQI